MAIHVTPIPRLTVLTVPAFTLGTANAAGSALTGISSDSTLLVYDTTVPTTIASGASAATGSATTSARRDHTHGAFTSPGAATQAEMEAASSTTAYVSPGRTQYHPGVAKGWVNFDPAGNLDASYNVASVTDSGTGNWEVNWATDFSGIVYAVGLGLQSAGTTDYIMIDASMSAGSTPIGVVNAAGTRTDGEQMSVSAFGDQA
jgi:hypothetical protein